MNEHQKVSTAERHQYTPFFKFKSTEVNLLSCLICFLDKIAEVDTGDPRAKSELGAGKSEEEPGS